MGTIERIDNELLLLLEERGAIAEMLQWAIYMNIVGLVIGSILMFVGVVAMAKWRSLAKENNMTLDEVFLENGTGLFCCLGVLCGYGIGALVCLLSVIELVQVLYWPTTYVLSTMF